MWKVPASILCLAALPLVGCAGNYTAPQAVAVTPAPVAADAPYYYAPAVAGVYATGPAAPSAVLVFLPGADVVASEPALWEAQGSIQRSAAEGDGPSTGARAVVRRLSL